MAKVGRPKKKLARGKKLTATQLKQAARQLGAKGGRATAKKNAPKKGGFWRKKK